MRFLRTAAAGAALLLPVIAAHASSIQYDLTLTATSDTSGDPLTQFDGTGTLTLPAAPSGTGLTNFGDASVTFLIDGVSFSGTASNVEFLNGNFYNATFSEQVGTSPYRFDLQTTGVYAFYYNNELQRASGTITAGVAPVSSATPEPSSLALLGTGLLGFAGMVRRRRV